MYRPNSKDEKHRGNRVGFAAALVCALLPVSLSAQTLLPGSATTLGDPGSTSQLLTTDEPVVSFQVAPDSVLGGIDANLGVNTSQTALDFRGGIVQEALDFNLGLQLAPLDGLNLRANVWSQRMQETARGDSDSLGRSDLFLQPSAISDFGLDNPLVGNDFESNGFDLGAAYVWETDRFGEFTLSSTTSYVDRFENRGGLLDLLDANLVDNGESLVSPELQSSLMLSWKFGNHTASAITNYFDSFKDISELDINEINKLVDSMTTLDLQYGYSVETGDKERAIISFGIRNIFNEDSAQILNATTRILDQNGRVAYGSIKYQF